MAQIDDQDSMEFALKRSLLAKSKRAIIVKSPAGVTEYRCVECPMGFNDKEDMEQHLGVHNKEYRFLCGICGTALKRKEHLDRHTMEHQEVRPHICPDCGKGFKRKEHLNIHRTIHSGEKNHTCPLCDKSFYRKDHLQKHLQTHNKMFIEQNIYPVSDQELMGIKQEVMDEDLTDDGQDGRLSADMMLELHDAIAMSKQAVEAERPHACPVCDKRFKRKDHLKLHSVSHLARDKLCQDCGKAFRTAEQLSNHKLIHAKTAVADGDEGFIIDEEYTSEDTEDPLLVPRLSIDESQLLWTDETPRPDRPYSCKICSRSFKRKQHLKVHANVHSRQQPPTIWCSLCSEGNYSCKMCSRSFERKQHLKVHANVHSRQQPPTIWCSLCSEGNYSCKMCSRSFERKQHLKVHANVHSRQQPPTIWCSLCSEGNYSCKICSRSFERKQHLKVHANVHSRQQPPTIWCSLCSEGNYSCKMCSRSFERKQHLKVHANVHSRQQPPTIWCSLCSEGNYSCKMCSRSFERKQHLKVHANVHSRQQPPTIWCSLCSEGNYSCKMCSRSFERKQHLKVHANVHSRQQPPTIWCSLCSEGFFNNNQFESHECMGAESEDSPPPANQENSYPTGDVVEIMNVPIVTEEPDLPGIPVPRRVFVCRFCSKPFKRKDHYRIHLHVHTGVKSFFCEDCGKGFYRKDHLQKHALVHNKVKPTARLARKPRKEMPDLFPIHMLPKKTESRVQPEITITAPSNTKLRVPLQIKVPYQVITSLDNGEQRAVTVDPRRDQLLS